MTKSVLLVGGGVFREEFIERCGALGIAPRICAVDLEDPDFDALAGLARSEHAGGIVAVDARSVRVALDAGCQLGLRVPPCVGSPGAWESLWKRLLEDPALAVEGVLMEKGEAGKAIGARMGMPCWVRPVGAECGAHCLYVEHEADLGLRIGQSARLSSGGSVLVQRAVEGPLWRVLGFKVGPDFVPVEAFEEEHMPGAYRVGRTLAVRGGVSAADYVPVTALACKVASMLPRGYGLLEFEIVLTVSGPRLADVRIRPYVEPGVDALLRAATGIRLLDDALRVAVGDLPHASACQGLSGALAWMSSDSGVLEAVEGLDAARALPGVAEVAVAVQPGEILGHTVDEASRDRVGYAVAVGTSVAMARARVAAVCDAIRFRTCRVSQ